MQGKQQYSIRDIYSQHYNFHGRRTKHLKSMLNSYEKGYMLKYDAPRLWIRIPILTKLGYNAITLQYLCIWKNLATLCVCYMCIVQCPVPARYNIYENFAKRLVDGITDN